jgi:hypothetical protein
MGMLVRRAALYDSLAAQGCPPLLLDQDGFGGPGFGFEAALARGVYSYLLQLVSAPCDSALRKVSPNGREY